MLGNGQTVDGLIEQGERHRLLELDDDRYLIGSQAHDIAGLNLGFHLIALDLKVALHWQVEIGLGDGVLLRFGRLVCPAGSEDEIGGGEDWQVGDFDFEICLTVAVDIATQDARRFGVAHLTGVGAEYSVADE